MKKITGAIFVLSAMLILSMMPASASDVSYNIRSTVYDSSDSSTPAGDFYWDASKHILWLLVSDQARPFQ
jgi:hypothetical protein